MKTKHFFLVILLVFVWGFNYVVIKVGLNGMPPVFLAFARFFLTSFPAVFFLKRPSVPFYLVALYGLVIFTLQFTFFFIGMDLGVSPGFAAILMQVHVFFSILLATLLFGEKVSLLQIIGALIAFSGIAYAGMHLESSSSLAGFFSVIAGGLLWGTGSVISKSIGKVNMLSLVVWGSTVAWPPLLLMSLLLEGPERILYSLENISWLSIAAVCYLTYFSTFFGYGLWSWLIYQQPLSTVAPFTLLIPIIAMLSSALLLKETIEGWKILSAFCVISGLSINFLGDRLFKKVLNQNDLVEEE
jgi:O-acetylserine/cysteine efflux transporter